MLPPSVGSPCPWQGTFNKPDFPTRRSSLIKIKKYNYIIEHMDYKKITSSSNTETRNVMELAAPVENVYEMVMIISKRANQLAVQMKQELDAKLQEFASYSDNLEEVFENHEQIEISRFYEKLPKPALIAIEEWKQEEIYYRNPAKEKEQF